MRLCSVLLLLAAGCSGLVAVQSSQAEAPLAASLSDSHVSVADDCTESALLCLEIRNDLKAQRSDEVAFSSVPIPKSANLLATANLLVDDLTGTPVDTQFKVISRWGGTVDDSSRPIRWLGIAIQDSLAALEVKRYALLQTNSPTPAPANPLSVERTSEGLFEVDTGAAVFRINPDSAALLDSIRVGIKEVYRNTPGAGPRLALPGGLVLDTSKTSAVRVDADSFEVIESGPLRASFAMQGHFVDSGGATLCDDFVPEVPAYEAMGFSIVMTMTRGTTDIDLQFNFRNECIDARHEPYLAGARTIDRVSWELPFDTLPTVYFAGLNDIAAGSGSVAVEQAKGGGHPWARRARVLVNGVESENGVALSDPFVGVSIPQGIATAQMPWMQFREPQALVVDNSALSLRFVSEPLVVGAAKGIWNFARVSVVAGAPGTAELESTRAANAAFLERGLLVRARLDDFNAAGVFPSMGKDDSVSELKTAYEHMMSRLHEDTVGTNGQHETAKTYGSQLWPDTQGAAWSIEGYTNEIGPTANPGSLDYWNAAGAEQLEFFRTGDPRWAWDFSLALTWQQIISAYVNRGEHDDGVRNGYALTSPICAMDTGLCEEGQWYRYSGGSDDYTYTSGNPAYVIRPTYMLMRRFAQAGRTTVDRYSIPRALQFSRERYVNQVDVTRQVVQHFEMLANCAEFVPGEEGQACHKQLMTLVTELIEENLSTGLMCQGDRQPPRPSSCAPEHADNDLDWCDCVMPQQFMLNSLMYPFFTRIFLNYGDIVPGLKNALTQTPWNMYRSTMGIDTDIVPDSPDEAIRPAIPLSSSVDWYGQPGWDVDTTPYVVQDVNVADNDPRTPTAGNHEASTLLNPNKPHTVALLLMAQALDPQLDLCNVAGEALNASQLTGNWNTFANYGGWWKGSAQMMQGMVFAVGINDGCPVEVDDAADADDVDEGDDGIAGNNGGEGDDGDGTGEVAPATTGGGALDPLSLLLLMFAIRSTRRGRLRRCH